jgi:hypothetical protein
MLFYCEYVVMLSIKLLDGTIQLLDHERAQTRKTNGE